MMDAKHTKSSLHESSFHDDDEIELRELFRMLWTGKWLIIGITFVAGVMSIFASLMLPNVYRAEALLAPNNQEDAGGLSSLAAQYGGLASLAGINLAGINLGGGSVDKTALGLGVLKSRRFITEFIDRHDILVPLMAAEDWDAKSDELKLNSDDYDSASNTWVRKVSFPRKKIPSMQEAYDKFMENLSVSQDKKSGFVTISFEHYSPSIAKQWVDWLVEDINATIMKQDVVEAEQSIAYLSEQINSTSLADLKNVFYRLIEEQTKKIMLAKASPEYMFRTLDPAVVPELKAKPKRLMIVVFSVIVGGLIGVVVVFIRNVS